MPADYAHNRFGDLVRERLKDPVRRAVCASPDCYAIGLQGPDIFFFYNPFRDNAVGDCGNAIHAAPGRALFEPAAAILREAGSEARRSYLAGLLCHFVLDSACHPFINEQVAQRRVLHTELEADFERALMVSEGVDMDRLRPLEAIRPRRAHAAAIAPFYPARTAQEIYKSYRAMRLCKKLLWAPNANRNALLLRLMHKIGLDEEICQIVVSKQPNPNCAEASARLLQLFHKAVPEAAAVIEGFFEAAEQGKELGARFDVTFG